MRRLAGVHAASACSRGVICAQAGWLAANTAAALAIASSLVGTMALVGLVGRLSELVVRDPVPAAVAVAVGAGTEYQTRAS